MNRITTGLFALAATAMLAACGSAPTTGPQPPPPTTDTTDTTAPPTPTPTPEQGCVPRPETVEEKIGLLFMLGFDTSAGAVDDSYRQTMEQNHIRSVVLLGNSQVGVDGVRSITDALDPDDTLLIAADQEGGQVQRLQGPGFDTMPAAVDQAAMSDDQLAQDATRWAQQLGAAGVDMNLAPVADVVPPEVGQGNEPVGALDRGYGDDPAVVGAKAAAFINGMHAGGQVTSVKHFPGLGAVAGNTDFSADVVDDRTGRDDAGLAAFEAAIGAGADSVMVATARYERIDPENLAAFSSVVIDEMIRTDLGYDQVVISDDMGAAAQVGDVTPGDRAVNFLTSGGDIVINGDPSIQPEMTDAVRQRAREDSRFRGELDTKIERILALHDKACASPEAGPVASPGG